MADKKNNTGSNNSGDRNSGNYNSGHYNSGDRNSGDYNSGDYNSGDYNSGHYNSGYRNSGHYNSGYRNSGYRNSGDRNSGNYNSGHYNSGHYNSGNYNSGWFNTDEPKMRFFNKESDYSYSEFISKFSIFYPDLKTTAWINEEDMTDTEKKEVDGWETMGGYLKTLAYKEAWSEYWDLATDDEKKFFTTLPNFDAAAFKEITGIDIDHKDFIEIGGQKYNRKEVEQKLKDLKPVK